MGCAGTIVPSLDACIVFRKCLCPCSEAMYRNIRVCVALRLYEAMYE